MSAAEAIASIRGLGKTRQTDLKYWRRSRGRIRAAAADWNSRSRAVAGEGGSVRDRGSGDVFGGELDAISMLDGTEKVHAQRQGGAEVRYRWEDVVKKENIAHEARGNEEVERTWPNGLSPRRRVAR